MSARPARGVSPTTATGYGARSPTRGGPEPLQPARGALRVLGAAEGLPATDVRCALADRRGDLWFGTHGGGVVRLADGAPTVFTREHGLAGDSVACACEDGDGRLWFGGRGASRFEPDRGRWREVSTTDGLSGTVVLAIRTAPDGALWFATNRGASRLHDGRWTSVSAEAPLPHFVVHDLAFDTRGDLWLATRGGLARRSADGWQVLRVGTACSRALLGPGGVPWFGAGSDGALAYVDGVFEALAPVPSLRPECLDVHGALWFGSDGGGAFRLAGRRVQRLGRAEGLPGDVVHAIARDGAGGLLFATDGGAAHLTEVPPPGA